MENRKNLLNNIPMILVLLGIITYISVDSGIVDWGLKFATSGRAKSDSVVNTQESLRNYADKLMSELTGVEKTVASQKENLKTVERKINDQKKSLSSLNREIESLKSFKETLINTKEKVRSAKGNSPARKPAGQYLSRWNTGPQDIQEIQDRISQDTKIPAEVEAIQYNNANFLRLKTKIKFSQMNSEYLAAVGLRQLAFFTEGAAKLNYKGAFLVYKDLPPLVRTQIQGITNLLQEWHGDKMAVSNMQLTEPTNLSDTFEIWMRKEEQ